MRIAQRTIYSNMVDNMQSTLGAYMESNIQGSSQKQVNRPSDDPAGTARIMNYRASLALNKQHSYNADTAQGWLRLGDEALGQVSTVVIKLKELAEQMSSGTYSPENRLQTSYAMRAEFANLMEIANAEFEGKHIFGGHKYDITAYDEGLAVTTGDPALDYKHVDWQATGGTDRCVMVRFPEDITIDAAGAASGTAFEWSNDGGATWNQGAMRSEDRLIGNGPATTKVNVLEAGGAVLAIPQPTVPPPDDPAGPPSITFKKYDPDFAESPEDFNGFYNGSQLIIRPGAYYNGDDSDAPQVIESFGAIDPGACSSVGSFSGDVRIRIDQDPVDALNTEYTPGELMHFSYSTDNGLSWTPAQVTVAAATEKTRLVVPGGFMDVDMGAITPVAPATEPQINPGQQFAIRPHRAGLGYEISPGYYMDVNNVGKDIFGGLYQTPEMKYPYDVTAVAAPSPAEPAVAAKPVFDGGARNLFEVASRLIAFTECNNQNGVQQCLEDLTTAHQTVMTAAAKIGGKENSLEISRQILSYQKLDKEERLSYVEDVDLTELLTRLSQQELAYSTVLKSSSMIMQLNLTKFI